MKYDSDEALANELTRIGRVLSPRPAGLREALQAPAGAVRSPLLLTLSSYMGTYTKLGATLVAIIVVAGGVYAISGPGDQGAVTAQQETATDSTAAMMKMAPTANEVSAPAADDSFDGFEASMEADMTAQQEALKSVDADADAEASSVRSVNNNPTYDENDI